MSDEDSPPFEEVLEPIARRCLDRLHGRLGARANVLSERAFGDLAGDLVGRLAHVCGPVLFEDFAALRDGQGRRSPTRRGLYERHVDTLLSGGWAKILADHAELARLIDVVTGSWHDASAEFVQRLASDRPLVAATFGANVQTGRVAQLRPGLSDPHGGGRSVCAVTFESGLQVVYKPRDVGIERAFAGLVGWLNEQGLDPPLRAAAALERPGYGWAEFISTAVCADRAAAERFYERAGVLAGLLDVLAATDMHYGNVVAGGENPVLVDLETLFHPLGPIGVGQGPADGDAGSVLRTGFIPVWSRAPDERSYDVSGLGSVARRETRIRRLEWSRKNSDEMALEERAMPIPRLANGPTLDGQPLSPADFADEILEGFGSILRLLEARAVDLLDASGPLTAMADQETRVLLRHTVTYRGMLERTLMPIYLRDGNARRTEIERLLATPVSGTGCEPRMAVLRADAERDALLQLDIPHFTTRPSATFLEIADGRRLEGWPAEPSFGQVARRLARLDAAELDRKARLLKATLELAGLARLMNPT